MNAQINDENINSKEEKIENIKENGSTGIFIFQTKPKLSTIKLSNKKLITAVCIYYLKIKIIY